MIRQRFSELSITVVYCIEAMRVVRQSAGIPQAVLQLLGEAARIESATYWTLERVDSRPQVRASWGVPPIQASTATSDWDIRHRAAHLRQGPVARVWRSGKPLWSASF